MIFQNKTWLIITSLFVFCSAQAIANCENKRSGYDPSYIRQVICKWNNGDTYEGGMTLEGRQSGFGIYTYSGGDIYSGNFYAGQPDGKGTYKFSSGNVHVGSFSGGKRNGQGVLTTSDDIYEGTWVDEIFHGEFKITNKYNRQVSRGFYADGEREGDWIIEEADGSKTYIKYRNGIQISSVTDAQIQAREARELELKQQEEENRKKELAKKNRELAKKQQLERQKRLEAAMRDTERRAKFAAEQKRKQRVVDQCLLKVYEDGISESDLEYLCEKMVDKSTLFKNCLIQKGRGKPQKIISAAVTACEAIDKNPSALEKAWYESGIGSLF